MRIPGFSSRPSRAPEPVDATGRPLTRITHWVNAMGKHRAVTQIGRIAPPSRPAVHDNSLINCERALRERVYYVKNGDGFATPPKPDPRRLDTLQEFRRKLNRCVPKLPALSWELFPSRYKDARKRNIYKNADSSLHEKSLSVHDAYVKGFIKDEKLDFLKKSDPVPRAILPLSPRLNIVEGSIISHREHAIFDGIDEVFGKKTVMKGLNAEEKGRVIAEKCESFAEFAAFSIDMSRFDQHVSLDMNHFENSVLVDTCCTPQERRELSKVLSWGLHSTGRMQAVDGKVNFERNGGRLSGCMHTSLGNIIIMCAMFWTFMQQFDIKWDYINDGDDCVLFLERKDVHKVESKIQEYFLGMGFTAVVEDVVYEIEKIDFCQSRPVWDGEGYLMCRNPHTALIKDTMCLKRIDNEANWGSWVRSVSESGIAAFAGMPIFQSFYECYSRSSSGFRVNKTHRAEGGLKLAAKGMHRKSREVDHRTRYSFWLAWGIQPDLQIYTEEMFSTMHLSYRDPPISFEGLGLPLYF